MICIDAAVALAAVIHNDPDHTVALNYLANLAAENITLCAPALFRYECDAVIRLQVYRGTLNGAQATTALSLIDALGVVLEFDVSNSDRTYEIATEYIQPRAYDAAYAAHAESRGIDFVTIDSPYGDGIVTEWTSSRY